MVAKGAFNADASRKTREMQIALMDSTVWNTFHFRSDDIVIATYAKAGTTWMQQIVAQLVFDGAESIDVQAISPWLETRNGSAADKIILLEAQRHRRFIKTHLPADALLMSPEARYIYVARDGRDVVWSMHNHHLQLKDEMFQLVNAGLPPGAKPFPRPDLELVPYFRRWLETGGEPWWPFWEHIRTWWALRHAANVHVVHFNDLKRDLGSEIGRIADFLDVRLEPAILERVEARCTFAYMKQHAERFSPGGGSRLKGGASSFINQGTNGRWRDMLSRGDIERYEATARSELGEACARWLANGGSTD